MTLGLDASCSCVGWAFSENNTIHSAGFIDIKKIESSKDKTLYTIDIISRNPLFKKIDKINIEASLSGFMGGFTSQQIIIKLARFNALFEYIISESWGLPVELLNVNTARKKVLGKCREKGIKSKDFVKMYLEKIQDIHKFDILNKRGDWDKRNSDTYDAIILSLF